MLTDPRIRFALVKLEFANYWITSKVSHFRWIAARPLSDVVFGFWTCGYEGLNVMVITGTATAENQQIRKFIRWNNLSNGRTSELPREMWSHER